MKKRDTTAKMCAVATLTILAIATKKMIKKYGSDVYQKKLFKL